MKRTAFLILVLVIMAVVGFYVRTAWEKPEEPQGGAAPAVPHDTTGAYENCRNCHGGIVASHNEQFGEGSYDDCLQCHRPQ